MNSVTVFCSMALRGHFGNYKLQRYKEQSWFSLQWNKALPITAEGLDSWNGSVSGPTLGSGLEAQEITQLHGCSSKEFYLTVIIEQKVPTKISYLSARLNGDVRGDRNIRHQSLSWANDVQSLRPWELFLYGRKLTGSLRSRGLSQVFRHSGFVRKKFACWERKIETYAIPAVSSLWGVVEEQNMTDKIKPWRKMQ
jgi:hypothetical protein